MRCEYGNRSFGGVFNGIAEKIAQRLTQPIHVERIRADGASIVSENRSTMIIHVDVNPLKIEGELPGNASIVVDKDTGMVVGQSELILSTDHSFRNLSTNLSLFDL